MPTTSEPNNSFSGTNISEKIEEFFKERKIDSTNALIPELSRYIKFTHNLKKGDTKYDQDGKVIPDRLDNMIGAYNQTMGRLSEANFLGEHKEEFITLMNELVEGHSHQERFTEINKKYTPIKETPEKIIIDNLKELLVNDTVINSLKQSDNDKEFTKRINDIVATYNNSIQNKDMASQFKASPLPIIHEKLKEMDKWCNETAKKDNSPIFQNIVKVIKHSLKAVASIIVGDMEAFKKEKENVRLYADAIKNSDKNTAKTIETIKASIKPYISSATSSSSPKNHQSRNQPAIGR